MRATEKRRAERASALTKKARAVGGRTGFLSIFEHRRRRSPAHRQATRHPRPRRDRAVAPPAPRTRHLRLAPPPRQAASAIRLFS
ncbi:arginase [Burkholderia mallei]|uniref:Arginase n=1 Tax=Burkholderia mallei TaxID=13373 RepID=A0AAX1ZUJ1_BURML|nr:arginase [Burkholderia pseudomallei]RPA04576.1 arginase [Burkholderia mallei]RPA15587.1 arginase [Burkholderia mallei]RPA42837.1 arginase [Burkholderia mallei]RUN03941.1 arginase [Burkholderia mallei]